ncbi:MAG: YybH family protein [Gemmatimonadales bacterium]
MRTHGIALALFFLGSTTPLMAQEYGPQPDAATRTEILAVREAAWRTWFANDQAGFQRVVPGELVALGWGGGPWEDRAQTLAQMGEFAKGGWTLDSLEFPRNIFQQYGDVVILYTAFRLVLRDGAGTREETTGRGTEVFVRRGGRWIHTGWHLDTIGS